MKDELINSMPCSLEAEQSLLGAILVHPACMDELVGFINQYDFYIPQHQELFASMLDLYSSNKKIDPVLLIDQLVKNGTYDAEDGSKYIETLAIKVPTASNFKDYAKIVKDKSVLRSIINTCSEITDIAYAEEDEAANIVDVAESKIFAISQGNENKNFCTIKEALVAVYDRLHLFATNPDEAKGVPTGFSGLDNVLVGLGNTDLVIVGARPGMGKTSFCLNIATNVALRTKKTVCIFSLEMSSEQLVSRMISSEALINSYKLRSGTLDDEDWTKLAHVASKLSETNILIDDTAGITVSEMRSKLRRVKNLGLVVVDYLQLMQGERHTDNRVVEVGDISRSLKLLAKEFGVPVVCCAQLSRGPESRATDKRPMLSDLRDSGAIEQDADIVLFLYRDEYYKNQETADQNIAEIIVAKNRHGAVKNVKMGWLSQFTKFTTLQEDSPDAPIEP